jgi:hypothetical protein
MRSTRPGLRAAFGRKRDIAVPLEAALRIPRGFAVAHCVKRGFDHNLL